MHSGYYRAVITRVPAPGRKHPAPLVPAVELYGGGYVFRTVRLSFRPNGWRSVLEVLREEGFRPIGTPAANVVAFDLEEID